METLTTNGVRITVDHQYQQAHSEPHRNRFLHIYEITIENRNSYAIQLLKRHWYILEDTGQQNEVLGDGVIGVQPVIDPGCLHAYSSYCVLASEVGKMHGKYVMKRTDDNTLFEVQIPEFVLVLPAKMN